MESVGSVEICVELSIDDLQCEFSVQLRANGSKNAGTSSINIIILFINKHQHTLGKIDLHKIIHPLLYTFLPVVQWKEWTTHCL